MYRIDRKDELSKYQHKIKHYTESCRCRYCGDWVRIPKFEKHIQKCHPLSKDSCPWCFGCYSYPPGEKDRHVSHFESCFKVFLKKYTLQRKTSPSPPPYPIQSKSDSSSSLRVYPTATYLNRQHSTASTNDSIQSDDAESWDDPNMEFNPLIEERDKKNIEITKWIEAYDIHIGELYKKNLELTKLIEEIYKKDVE